MTPRQILRLEGAVVFITATTLYVLTDYSIWWYALLLLSPDISMFGYLKNPKVGAVFYNLAHNYAVPLVLVLVSALGGFASSYVLGLIWIAHIGLDRALGYGLKQGNFLDTHLGKIGKKTNLKPKN